MKPALGQTVGRASLLLSSPDATRPRAVELPGAPDASTAELAVEIRDLSFSYGRRQPVLESVSLEVPFGGATMVLGASGSGKTTLLKLIKGLHRPSLGEVRVLGEAVAVRHARRRLDSRVAYIPQQLGLVRSLSVMDNVLTGAVSRIPAWRSLAGLFPPDVVREARSRLTELGIAQKEREKVRSLSGGERQRVAIARALLQQPRIILADEFVSQLDPATTAEIMDLIRQVTLRGVPILMTTHELDLVQRFADRVVVLRAGRKVLDCQAGDPSMADLTGVMKP